MAWRVDPVSWLDNGGDVSWRFSHTEGGGQVRHVRAGVREAAREMVVRATRRFAAGDWTAVLITYAAAAAELAAPDVDTAWVTPANVETARQLVDGRRRADRPLVADVFVRP